MIPSRCAYCISIPDPERRIAILKIRKASIRTRIEDLIEKEILIEEEISLLEEALISSGRIMN